MCAERKVYVVRINAKERPPTLRLTLSDLAALRASQLGAHGCPTPGTILRHLAADAPVASARNPLGTWLKLVTTVGAHRLVDASVAAVLGYEASVVAGPGPFVLA